MRQIQISYTEGARREWFQLTHAQKDQVRRLVAALKLSPQAGWFYRKDDRGRALFIVSASDTHLVYNIQYIQQGDLIVIVTILTFPLPSIHDFEERSE